LNCSTTTADTTSAPPTSVGTVSDCDSTSTPSTAVRNGSTVETIAVRTGPSRTSPMVNRTPGSTVENTASAPMVSQASGVSR